jgi:hypothetical protein
VADVGVEVLGRRSEGSIQHRIQHRVVIEEMAPQRIRMPQPRRMVQRVERMAVVVRVV